MTSLSVNKWYLTCLVGKRSFSRNSNYSEELLSMLIKISFFRLVEMTFELVHVHLQLAQMTSCKTDSLCTVVIH